MSWWYRNVVRPALFSWDSEPAHNLTLNLLAHASRHRWLAAAVAGWIDVPPVPVDAFGLRFPNPVGLAAGMDKQGVAVPFWSALGFGFSELGGVTWHPQPGNPEPRMFRLVAEEALINRMGFNNGGAAALAERLAGWRRRGLWPAHPVGVNLGKSKITPLSEAADDYAASFEALWSLADFFVVNVSSPNTPNLRQLQDRAALDEILARLQEVNATRARMAGMGPRPLLVKVAPDLTFEALDQIVGLVGPRSLSGLVATNTTLDRPAPAGPVSALLMRESGGLSGRPLRRRSTEVIRHLHRQLGRAVPIIGVGGIASVDDAWEKITAGATLLQVYSALVYEGPGLVARLVEGIRERSAGAPWSELVGSSAR